VGDLAKAKKSSEGLQTFGQARAGYRGGGLIGSCLLDFWSRWASWSIHLLLGGACSSWGNGQRAGGLTFLIEEGSEGEHAQPCCRKTTWGGWSS